MSYGVFWAQTAKMSFFHGKNDIFKLNLGTLSCVCEITPFWTKKCVLRLEKWENTSEVSPNKRICTQTLPKSFYATFSKIQNFVFFSKFQFRKMRIFLRFSADVVSDVDILSEFSIFWISNRFTMARVDQNSIICVFKSCPRWWRMF